MMLKSSQIHPTKYITPIMHQHDQVTSLDFEKIQRSHIIHRDEKSTPGQINNDACIILQGGVLFRYPCSHGVAHASVDGGGVVFR